MIWVMICNLLAMLGMRHMMATRRVDPYETIEDWLKNAYIEGDITIERLEELLERFRDVLHKPSSTLRYVSL